MIFKIIEFILLCVVFPSIIIFNGLGSIMFTFLWSAAAYCLAVYLIRYKKDALLAEWNFKAFTAKNLKEILLRWVLASLAMIAFVYFYEPQSLFGLIQERPQLILFLVFFYPLFSALPQEFIFCSYFFKRYEELFKTKWVLIVASALVFAYAHMLFINWIAPTFSFAGGLIFASTYYKTRSLALVTLEHGLYGLSIFIIGLGWYFYSGAL